jgi:hypothetical protein
MMWRGCCESVFDVLVVVGVTDLVMLVGVVVRVFFRVGIIVGGVIALDMLVDVGFGVGFGLLGAILPLFNGGPITKSI